MTLNEWVVTACDALGLDALTPAEQQVVLDVARDVAHGVVRPAAPVSTFLLGVAVGRGADLAAAQATLSRLAGEAQQQA